MYMVQIGCKPSPFNPVGAMSDHKAAGSARLYAACRDKLAAYGAALREDPVTTAVRKLHLDFSDQRQAGALSRKDLGGLVDHVGGLALAARARRLAAGTPRADDQALLDGLLEAPDFDALKRRLERPPVGVVFTAHPTFAHDDAASREIGDIADGAAPRSAPVIRARTAISLGEEHEAVLAALDRAQDALSGLVGDLGAALRARFPKRWREIAPAPLSLATWVGYDLDGRADIGWGDTLRIRLDEKARQLRRYARALRRVGGGEADALAERLARAGARAEAQSQAFAADMRAPDSVVAAANLLTRDHEDRLVSLTPIIAEVSRLLDAASDDKAQRELYALRSEMLTAGLGVARLHLRVNAAQIRSAVRAELGLDADSEFLDAASFAAAAEKVRAVRSRAVNFASVFLEEMTARRQFMLCAQILKHIDADQPIRFLIAEIEAPATVMSALYLAKAYGVDGAVDISPLFETSDALDQAGRFVERLLRDDVFRAYLRTRGRIAVQFGFSDSGRFMGQLAADMAIERAHVLLARALDQADLADIEAVIFNTHGEAMGRGGRPGDFTGRLDHLATPWVRARFARSAIPTVFETSFQGGDGYLHFATPLRAEATLRAVAAWAFARPAADHDDVFYKDINYSWDVFRAVKTWQEDLFADRHYQSVLSVVGPNLLPVSGSRRTRRQTGASAGDVARALRAIPNNAILQTLAAPANVWGGLGAVAAREPERFSHLVAGSPRMQALVALAAAARRLTSMSVLRSYATLYSPGFWAVLAAQSPTAAAADRATIVSERLARRNLDLDFDRLANLMSVDRRRGDSYGVFAAERADEGFDPDLYILHAVRLTLIAEGFRLAATTPTFSRRHEATRESLVDHAIELRFAEVADLVDEIFPGAAAPPPAFNRLTETADREASPTGYPFMRRDISDPLREIDAMLKNVAVAISHFYSAYG